MVVHEAARDLASAILHLQQVRKAKTQAAGMLDCQVRKPRQRKKPPPDCFDGMSSKTLISLIHEYDDRGAFQLPDKNAGKKVPQQRAKPPPQQANEVDRNEETPPAPRVNAPEEHEAMLRWILARQKEIIGDQELTPRQMFGRRSIESELYSLVEARRRNDPVEETREVTLEETLESLRRLDDYERRALSRRKKAIRRLDYEILEARRGGKALPRPK